MTIKTLVLRSPDDWHCHLRDQMVLSRTVADTVRRFRRAVVMPNLLPPIVNMTAVYDYYQRILTYVPAGFDFTPLMTLYLTTETSIETLHQAKESGVVIGCKLYPANATTHSAAGIKNLTTIYPLLAFMEEIDLPLLIHGEVTDPEIDIFDREKCFIDQQLVPLLHRFPKLRVVLEHISTRYAVDFVRSASRFVGATITPHHLLLNRNHLLRDGLRPHHYCMPILKTIDDQQALIEAAISGDSHFFLGTDSAPHAQHQKETVCGCAGIYSAHAAIELYAQVFAAKNALDQLEGFASVFGAQFYKQPLNESIITLVNESWQLPSELSFGDSIVIPFFAGQSLDWQLKTGANELHRARS